MSQSALSAWKTLLGAGGWGMGLAGLVFHYLIAYSFAVFYFFVYPNIALLQKNKIVSGLAYGVCIWVVMNWVVLPLSSAPPLPFNLSSAIVGVVILMPPVGLPIAWISERYYRGK